MIGGHGNFQGPELLAAPGIFQGAWKFSGPGNFTIQCDISLRIPRCIKIISLTNN